MQGGLPTGKRRIRNLRIGKIGFRQSDLVYLKCIQELTQVTDLILGAKYTLVENPKNSPKIKVKIKKMFGKIHRIFQFFGTLIPQNFWNPNAPNFLRNIELKYGLTTFQPIKLIFNLKQNCFACLPYDVFVNFVTDYNYEIF